MNVIVVGGGIAGLAAGTYARQSGFDVTLYEMHSIPGGNSTSWKRKGYLFEGGMHWLVGSGQNAPLYPLWREVGALGENNPIYNKDPFLTYMDSDTSICLYRNPDRLKEHLLSISPEDERAIEGLVKDIKAFENVSMPVMDVRGVKVARKQSSMLSTMFSMIGALPRMGKLNKTTTREYSHRFKHPGIRTLMGSVVEREDFSATSIAFTLAGLSVGDAGYPEGGSLRMAQNMADAFEAAGGTIHYRKRVEKIEVRDGRACGGWIDGILHEADAVIVTADARAAIDTLFERPLKDSWAKEMRQDITPLNNTFISIGVKADLSDLPETMIFPLDHPFEYGGTSINAISFNNYATYEGYAPSDCTALTCFLGATDTYDQWKQARTEGTYKQKKEELAQIIIDRLAEVIPRTAGKVEVWDVATPLTYERYCGTWRGSWMSVMGTDGKRQTYPSKSDSIDNIYFAGQRLMLPGGLPSALSTGRQAVQYLCKDTSRVFQGELSK